MCYDPYIAISQTDVEKEIKLALGLDAMLDIDAPGGGYVTVLEALDSVGEVPIQEEFRGGALEGNYPFLRGHCPGLRGKVAEYWEEQAKPPTANTYLVTDGSQD